MSAFARSTDMGDARARNLAALLIAAFALARLALMLSLGLGQDEAYTLVVSRKLALSYFDHPPLHQWIAHFAALALGETVWTRLPFVLMFAATGWLMFALTRELFGACAGLIALIALNLSPYFLISAGGWVTPDGPLLFCLAAASLTLRRLFFKPTDRREAWTFWLLAGLFLGLAGLSKYSAALTALGVGAFLLISPRQRRWLGDPAFYAGALVAAAMVSPVFIWNAEHDWASFAFQGGRGSPGLHLRPVQVIAMLLGEIAYLTPWIFVALVGALVAAARRARRGDDKRLFLLCLALPPIVVFTLTPLWGARGLPHWPMPGWFFAYPLMGAWLVEPWARRLHLRRWAIGTAALMAALAALGVWHSATGGLSRHVGGSEASRDPTLEALPWTKIADAPALRPPPDFVVTRKWWEAGKVGVALGPDVPLFVFSNDPRGVAFLDDSARFIGRDAVIVVPAAQAEETQSQLKDYFERFDPPQFVTLGRGGQDEVRLALIPAHALTRAFPVPYPLKP